MSTPVTPSGGFTWAQHLDMLGIERDEINRVKWLESERLGYDCGIEYAIWVWETTERKKWLKRIRESSH